MPAHTRITLQELKNRVISLVDVSEKFINNLDDDNFTNICNDTQKEIFRLFYKIYGDDSHQTYADLSIPAEQGYFDFANSDYYTEPFVIYRLDHLSSENRRKPMRKFDLIQETLDEEPKSWTNRSVEYDWRPTRLYFNPKNAEAETVRMYYIPKPAVLTSNDGYLERMTEDHIELAALLVGMKVFAKEETAFTELEKLYNIYINRIEKMPPKDFGRPKHIIDVQSYGDRDAFYDRDLQDWFRGG